jgi:2-polyprenyl-3-methyl-5-hydroxy-6-metoxy-1,4-benzoquinol methylase
MIKSNLIPNVSWCKYGEIISCPFCNSLSSRQHIYEEYSWVTLNIVACNDCNHISSNPRPIKESLIEYYSSQYLKNPAVMLPSKKEDIFQIDSLWSKKMERYNYYLSLVPKLDKKNPEVLDIGCSWGGLLLAASLKLETSSLSGVDVSSKAIEFISKDMGFNGFKGTLLDYNNTTDKKFDYIFSSHSLEHSLDPKEELLAIKGLLNNNGVFFLTIPNHSSFMTNQMRGYSPAVRGGNHYHFFSHDFLLKELKEIGFKILDSFTSSIFSPHINILDELLNNTKEVEELDKDKEGEFLYFILQ